ncbi:YegS/Rv2252/BmrU family lipid kinase [Acetivibrio mesophilus]|uniref:YegS/Rv2252/BmrU family lipid kinase n=1 Tax=Acetivibrio mesophilus TaxID=2487273 RepID=A0A4Q0I2L7_9FIRM|nr:YegS/Rv2252/BmrU family lipid kinase [Acetivibrio mesophilus]ODM27966.1 lipid kinase [Clostridium sp. Bc-iso-3]RXE58401.1 YegS/Rv2252/BmrU family lipid kinase [Acetivibrio mesophilus]HHV28834.1 YegS/Rv2252/BmrU family lipid kinase [Clostridium sp.]
MDKALLVYNPFSGDRGIIQKLDFIIQRFQQEGILLQPYRIMEGCEKNITSLMTDGSFKFVISSGGDGTLNFICNILMENNLSIPMGIIPAGTCNDFASILNIPTSIEECVDIILRGRTVDVDVGVVDKRTYFLSSCAGGVFVDVSFSTDSELKKNLGAFAYYLKALSEMANMKPFKVTIETDKEVFEDDILLFFILNGNQAGGFHNLMDAVYDDGLMDIVIIKDCRKIELAGIFYKVISNELPSDKNVVTIRTDRCTIKSSKEIILSIDGEKGPALPVEVRFVNKALKVFA